MCAAFVRLQGISHYKFKWVYGLIGDERHPSLGVAFVVFVLINAGLAAVAAYLVAYVEPVAAGSGIPEIKCYLNGVKVPRVVRFKTLLAKAIGVLFSVGSNLAVGREGPMIASGSVIGGGLSQGKSSSMAFDTQLFRSFRSDRQKRDTVTAGASAGVAAAFGAPVGGVLFSLEEGASFWNQSLTWRVFFCSMISTFTLNTLLSGTEGDESSGWGHLSQPGLVNFGEFSEHEVGYTVWQVPFYLLVGVVGGLMGALFNQINLYITRARMRWVPVVSKHRRFAEVIVVSMVTSIALFVLAFYVNHCKAIPSDPATLYLEDFVKVGCPKGSFNDMATIAFTTQEAAIKMLFHNTGEFDVTTLLVFGCVYFLIACWTYGIAVPSGLFVPCLLTGAAVGRLLGTLLQEILPDSIGVDPRTMALVGAAAMLGGVVRMTISITVILVEATNDLRYAFPIMASILVSKWVGDMFTIGIYDMHIELKNVPLLEWEAPQRMKMTQVSDVMTKDVKTLRVVENVGEIYDLLMDTKHNGFPVISKFAHGRGDGSFVGLILRRDLCTLLEHKMFFRPQRGQIHDDEQHRLTQEEMNDKYPWFPAIGEISLTEEERAMSIDLSPYYNRCPFVVEEHMALSTVFQLFRNIGLRHVVVLNDCHEPVGIITRFDLVFWVHTNHAGH